MAPASSGRVGFVRQLLRALPVLVGVSVLTALADSVGWFSRLETTALDAMLASAFPRQSERTFLVVISDEDYHSVFDGRSPLDASRLGELLEGVAAAGPRLIVVDIDTSAPDFRSWADNPAFRDVVWARDAVVAASGLSMGRVLGSGDPVGVSWGLAVLPADRDGVIRRYRRTFESGEAAGAGRTVPSLAVAAADTLCAAGNGAICLDRPATEEAGAESRVMRFAGARTRYGRLSASAVLEAKQQAWWPDTSPLRDRIVIVGGTYRAARDEYVTPLGPMDGVQLVAQAVESELDGHVRPVSHTLMVGVEFLAGVFFVYLNYRFPPGRMLNGLLNASAVLVLAVLSSFVVFATFSSWVTFVPIGFAIRLHRVYERFAEQRRERRELEAYRRLYGELPREGD